MNDLTTITCLLGAFFLIACPQVALAQGVESEPTGVEKMAPGFAESDTESSRGWLGVMLQAPDDDRGVDVVQVLRGSPAQRGGLKQGDRILRVDDRAVGSANDVQAIVGKKGAGDKTTVELRRGQKSRTLTIALGEAPGTQQVLRQQFVGHPAPALSADMVGEEASFELEKLQGKPVIVDFWATWCGPCRPMSQKLAKLRRRVGERVHFVGLTSETPQAVERHLAKTPHGFPVATTDEAVMQTYLIESYPTVFVVDAKGDVAGVFVGLGHGDEIGELVDRLAGSESAGSESAGSESAGSESAGSESASSDEDGASQTSDAADNEDSADDKASADAPAAE